MFAEGRSSTWNWKSSTPMFDNFSVCNQTSLCRLIVIVVMVIIEIIIIMMRTKIIITTIKIIIH